MGVCPNFVGPGRFVGQLLAVVLRFWDTPMDGPIPADPISPMPKGNGSLPISRPDGRREAGAGRATIERFGESLRN
jgi:hypothetical protein